MVGPLNAADLILRSRPPGRIQGAGRGYALGIARMFLTDAWLWPEIWYINPRIENPHLIYPGDTIVLRMIDGKPRLTVERGEAGRTDKLSPAQPVREGDRHLKLEPRI
ncbi:MAG: hypothetical protein U5O39_18895 [Gammaproteobacteria bacterium]|nr:hypothetical protein [Gammaproteobacteria bacterium]